MIRILKSVVPVYFFVLPLFLFFYAEMRCMNLKKRLIKLHAWSVMLYGRETCVINKKKRKELKPQKFGFGEKFLK